MFNLLIFNDVDWSSGSVTVPDGRMFEYTDEHIKNQFLDSSNNILFDRISSLPCLFCEEGEKDEKAYVGQINKAQITKRGVLLEVICDTAVPPLLNSTLYANRAKLNISNFEFSRNHWAVKDVDIYRFLLRHIPLRRQRPSVFQIPEHERIEPNLASAMMPFDAAFNDVYSSICEAAKNAGLECKRADDIWENASIIQDVVSLIDRSRIVVCDCTGRNPNVFYEAGIAHTLGRDVILITQSEHDIPFDLRHLRYIRYLNNAEGRLGLTTKLQERMQTLLTTEA
ncbi:MAG TPA: hypothetical protein VLS45_10745 [Methylomicrobium sp.]|nr:hypothetical protein [Methylomicrobium sp.]